jgi:pimeloyl-ACP methyl ester carboxylesterase
MPKSPGERLAGGFYSAVTRVAGLRTELIPAHMRRQFQVIGISDDQLARVLRSVRRLGDWPYAWEAEGDRQAAHGDALGAMVSYYVAQRLLTTETPLKRRLYRLAVDAYLGIEQHAPLELLRYETDLGNTIAGYLQVPTARSGRERRPLVLLVPGVTSTKEELHPVADAMLRRGWAVARMDNPGYGETTGTIQAGTERHPALVLDELVRDPRIDPHDVHLWGASLGGFFALHSSVGSRARSVVSVAAPFAPASYFPHLPGNNLSALAQMTGLHDYPSLRDFCLQLALEDVVADIEVPTKVFHGGRDRTIPVDEGRRIVEGVAGPSSLTVYERDHHICLEHLDEMIALSLEWYRDPTPQVRAWQRELAASRVERSIDLFGHGVHSPPPVERVANPG